MSDIITYNIPLDDESIESIENLAAIDYSPRKIAIYLGVDVGQFEAAAANPNSYIYEIIQRAKIRQEAGELISIFKKSKDGKIDAQKRIDEIRRSRAWAIQKTEVFGAFKTSNSLERLNDYIQQGGEVYNPENVEESIYMDALLLLRDIDHNYGHNKAVEFARNHFKIKHDRAVEMLKEVNALFFHEDNVDKNALRHKFAYKLEALANAVAKNAETSQDAERAKNILMSAATLLELDKPDPEALPADLYIQPLNIFSLDGESTGIGAINRHAIASEIDDLDVPIAVKNNLKEDALLDPLNIPKRLQYIEENFTD